MVRKVNTVSENIPFVCLFLGFLFNCQDNKLSSFWMQFWYNIPQDDFARSVPARRNRQCEKALAI
jgi:hypothetical protein